MGDRMAAVRGIVVAEGGEEEGAEVEGLSARECVVGEEAWLVLGDGWIEIHRPGRGRVQVEVATGVEAAVGGGIER